MSYSEYTWQMGETITAEKLNNLEGGVQEALSGYECVEIKNLFTEENVTTISQNAMNVGQFSYSQIIDADSLIVTIDGTSYEVSKFGTGDFIYGGFSQKSGLDFSEYPFAIWSSTNGNTLYTPQSGTYSVKIESLIGETVTTSECFEKAVKLFVLKNVADAENGSAVANNISLNVSSGRFAFAEGNGTQATGDSSHAEGGGTKANSNCSHAEGGNTTASGSVSHAEGGLTQAKGDASHAEGQNTKAIGANSHAEGSSTTANGLASHAEGGSTTAGGAQSHAEGGGTTTSGFASHAEGGGTTANGTYSHTEGEGTIAQRKSQHVFGEYNIEDTGDSTTRGTYVEIVGNGATNSRSNARTLDWSGNESLQGSLTLGKGTADETTITAAQLKALIALLNS